MFPNFPDSLAIPCFLLLGATFILFVYHLLLYLHYREKIILRYCIYLLAISLYLLADMNLRISGTTTGMTTKLLLSGSFNFMVILAYASFLIEAIPASKMYYPRLYKIWQFASMATIAYISFCLLLCIRGPMGFERIIDIMNNVFRIMFVIIGLVATLALFPLIRDKFQVWIKWGAVSYLFFMGLVMIVVLFRNNEDLLGLSSMHYVYLGTLADIIIFSAAMSYKIKDLMLKVTEERGRLSRDLHDEIGATLSGVTLMSELVKNKLQNGSGENLVGYIERISNESRLLTEKMNDIIWAANPGNDSLEKIILRIQYYAGGICSAKNIRFHHSKPAEINDRALTTTTKNNLYLISKEAINNAVKYSGAGNIWFSVGKNGNHYQVLIRDDGSGFEMNGNANGNGLKNMKIRAEEMGAAIQINSGAGQGTNVELRFR
jgi:signal transduction histidine kinase